MPTPESPEHATMLTGVPKFLAYHPFSARPELSTVSTWNPEWKPRFVMSDFSQAQISATESVFPGSDFVQSAIKTFLDYVLWHYTVSLHFHCHSAYKCIASLPADVRSAPASRAFVDRNEKSNGKHATISYIE